MRPIGTVVLASMLWGCAAAAANPASARPVAASKQSPRTEPLVAEAIADLQIVTDVALSPDGKQVAFVVRVPRKATDKPGGAYRALHVVDTKGGAARQFTFPPDGVSAPQWSPDGKQLAYVGRRDGDPSAQVFVVATSGGDARAVATGKTSVREIAWMPDGKRIAYTADREPTADEAKDHEAGRDWKVGDVDGTFRQLHVVTLDDGKSQSLTPRTFHVERIRVSPKGDALAIVGGTRADVDGTMMYGGVYRVAAAGGEPKRLCDTAGKLGDLAWSKDANTIAFLGAADINDPTAGVVWTVPATGGKAKALTLDFEGTAQWVRFDDAARLVVLAQRDVATVLLRIDPRSGKLAVIDDRGPVCHGADFVPRTGAFACAGETRTHPSEVFVGKLGGSLQRITHHNPALDRTILGEQSVFRWKAADGLALAGIVTMPVGWKKGERAPLVVMPHGGPEGISFDGWNTRSGYPAQLFATAGYAVFEPNYRGSSGRGVAFGKADHGDLGGKEFADVLAGIDALVAEGRVDPERVGMGGWSYGGYFSGLAATVHTGRFKAAMVGAAITNWMSFTGTSEIEHENSLVHWKLWPYDEHALVWSRSPMAHTAKAKTATLIVHGSDDTRVPPEQAKELYRALKHAKVATEVVFYPREGHGLGERAHQIDFMTRFVKWFDTHLRG
jgi:dipeptidyl aminopeptidase/acylaminoacyl peptidase